jgi:RNA-directed DNA polymerase
LRKIMSKLKLTVNEEKTRICRVPEGEFNFLGYSFGRMQKEARGIDETFILRSSDSHGIYMI